ncbi:MAG: hypothetical protein ABIS84_05490 [Arachnia sp.]
MTDLIYAADLLEIDPAKLIPRRAKEDPALDNQDGIFTIVAGTGFEPVTSGPPPDQLWIWDSCEEMTRAWVQRP